MDKEPLRGNAGTAISQLVSLFPLLMFGFLFSRFCIAGKGSKVSFVLNQDFHSGYANENSTAYSILANNVKGEVRLTVVLT